MGEIPGSLIMMKVKFFHQVGGRFEFPLVVDELIDKCANEKLRPQAEKLAVMRALYQNPKLSSNNFVVLITSYTMAVSSVMSLMETFNLVPATFADLLFFGSSFPQEVDGPIMAFGTKIMQPDGSYLVPNLDGGICGGQRTVSITSVPKVGFNGLATAFGGGWAYLAYPKLVQGLESRMPA